MITHHLKGGETEWGLIHKLSNVNYMNCTKMEYNNVQSMKNDHIHMVSSASETHLKSIVKLWNGRGLYQYL